MPKVAVISHASPDYLIDIVSDGLIRSLGRESLHLNYRIGGPSLDMRVGHLFQGFEGANAFPPEEADCLITSTRVNPILIDEWMIRTKKDHIAILDGEDDGTIREDFRERAKVYFKREFLRTGRYSSNVRPLPFGAIPEKMKRAEKTKALFYRVSPSDPMRWMLALELASMGFEIIDHNVPKHEYNLLMASARVCPCVRGAGWDTYRYWEVPYFGSVLLAQKHPLYIQNDFIEGKEALFFRDLDDFKSKLSWILNHPEDADRIASEGQRKCNQFHLSTHRASSVLQAIL